MNAECGIMKTKLILLSTLVLGLFACTSKPKTETFKINVNQIGRAHV